MRAVNGHDEEFIVEEGRYKKRKKKHYKTNRTSEGTKRTTHLQLYLGPDHFPTSIEARPLVLDPRSVRICRQHISYVFILFYSSHLTRLYPT